MFSNEALYKIVEEISNQLNHQANNHDSENKKKVSSKPCINTAQLLVILGLLGGALDVESVLVDKNQTVNIVLFGSLKRKTELDKMLDKIGEMRFDEVMQAFINRLN